MEKKYSFYAYMDRMKFIKRWQLMRSMREENIMEHSQSVALISHALAVIHNGMYPECPADEGTTVLYAVYHETSEVMTGDLPTPIKYYNGSINSAYKDMERLACKKMVGLLPEDMQGKISPYIFADEKSVEYKLMKAADRLSAYIRCIEERKCGNNEFIKAEHSILADLKGRHMKEVDYFLEEFIPAFSLTLDELESF